MRKKSALLIVSLMVTAVFLFSTVNVFADEASQDVDESSSETVLRDYGRFIKHKVKPWKGRREIDLEQIKEERQERFESMLSDLVDEGIITQDKSDEILKQYEEFMASIELKKEERMPIYEQLVEEGILTQEEADAVKKALSEKRNSKIRARIFYNDDKKEILKEKLLELVDEDVLTENKVDEIINFFENKISEKQELKESKGFWNQMVDNGVITEEEANSIKEYCAEKIKENCRKFNMSRFKYKRGLRNS